MRKIRMMSVMVASVVMLFGQMATAQEGGQQRNRGQRGAGQQDQQDRGQRGPQGGQQRGGRSISMIALASIEAVQAEIDMLPDQVKELTALQEKLRGDRGTQTRRSQDEADDEEDLDDEEDQEEPEVRRTQAMDQAAEYAKKADEGLKDILLDQQFARLREVYIQALGIAALQDEAIAKELKITEKQTTAMQEVSAKAREAAIKEFAKLRESGDREAMQKKFAEMRKESEAKVLGILSAKQKSSFEKMKGEAFEIPAEALRGQWGRGQRGGGDQRQRGRQRGDDESNDDGDRL